MVILMYREEMEDDGCGEEQRKDGEEGRMSKELKRFQGIGMEKEWMKRRRTGIAESLWRRGYGLVSGSGGDFDLLQSVLSALGPTQPTASSSVRAEGTVPGA